MFSQKLPVLRLPCNVFHQVRLLTAKRGKFTVEEILKHEDKTANYKQKYTKEESVRIMKAVFDDNKNVLEDNNIGPSADVWKEFCDELNKRPRNIYLHWQRYIHPTLVRYEAGVLVVDFKETLINYMVDNNIMRRNIQTYLKVK